VIPYLSLHITASAVAWYGAIVSTLALGISTYNAWRDRARPQITWQPGVWIAGDAEYPEGVLHSSVNVRNRGRRPIRVEQAFLSTYGQPGLLLLASSFSNRRVRVIDEQNPSTSFLVRQDQIDVDNVYCIIVLDGAGRTYKKYLKRFPTFTRAFRWIRGKLHI
jgi:hypothetical protein